MVKKVQVAVFDLDGTITRHDTYIHFLLTVFRAKPLRLLKSPMLFLYFFMYKSGMRTNHWLKARFLGLVVGGLGKEELQRLSKKFCQITLKGNVKKQALTEIQQLQKNDYKVVLATASFGFYVEELAQALSVDELLCSVAQVDASGCLTGEIDGLNCIGEEKARRVEGLLAKRGWSEVDRAYSDDKVDFPLLKIAKTALVVDPKPATKAVAVQSGFQILSWK